MEHADALERIEIAAAEPQGLERLMAGDTPDAAAMAGHLAGCPACVEQLARIRRTADIAREVIRAQPDPALRERTLAFVRAVGRDRSGAVATADGATAAAPGILSTPPTVPPVARAIPVAIHARAAWRPRLAWVAGLAAALVVATTLGFAVGGGFGPRQGGDRSAEVSQLRGATAAAMRIAAQPDARHVALAASPGGGSAAGSLVFSPGSGELVVVATGLAPVAAGQEYGCWVEVDGQRRRLGRMYRAGDLWTWAGPASGLADLPAGAVFGVSAGPAGGGGTAAPVLTGSL